jgi:hypothetical protein
VNIDIRLALIGIRKYQCDQCEDVHEMPCYDGELLVSMLEAQGLAQQEAFDLMEAMEGNEEGIVVWKSEPVIGSMH